MKPCTYCKTVGKYHAKNCLERFRMIYKEEGYEHLTPEDMKWIEENIKNGTEPIILSPKEIERIEFWEENGRWPVDS